MSTQLFFYTHFVTINIARIIKLIGIKQNCDIVAYTSWNFTTKLLEGEDSCVETAPTGSYLIPGSLPAHTK